jgi:2-amino-4-hydroxy-6-hydroxymethyldihydropteridine diphosphokinase
VLNWQPAFIGLGSNLSQPATQVRRAMDELESLPDTTVVARSGTYRSAPMGPADQPDFANAVVGILTQLSPRQLLGELLALEQRLGRGGRAQRWGPRIIDLDLLVYDAVEISEPGLVVPHPGLAERRFVLQPLADIAPDLMIPGLGRVSKILKVCSSEPVFLFNDLHYDQ